MDYKQAIRNKGLKQVYVAKQIGVSEAFFCRFLKGNKKMSVERENKLKKFLNLI